MEIVPSLIGEVSKANVCRSVLAAEFYACAHAYDVGVAVKHSLYSTLGRNIDIILLTDSLALFDCLITWCTTSERRLQIDIAVLRQSIASKALTNVAWIRTAFNPSDGLTRPRACDFLEDILRTHTLKHPIAKIIRQKNLKHVYIDMLCVSYSRGGVWKGESQGLEITHFTVSIAFTYCRDEHRSRSRGAATRRSLSL
jgi:hypothetical protein